MLFEILKDHFVFFVFFLFFNVLWVLVQVKAFKVKKLKVTETCQKSHDFVTSPSVTLLYICIIYV